MATLKFKTNINCNNCKATASKVLNNIAGVKNWNVDIVSPEKYLTVEGENIKPEDILGALENVGFKGQLV
jgi:copper chaperone